MSRAPAAVLTACLLVYFSAQTTPAQPPATAARPAVNVESLRPVFDGLKARCIGPANMGGRVVDLAVVESNPDVFYVATAGGGVWKTTDGGTTLTSVFDGQPTQCTGSIAVCQSKPEVVYVGTGEGNPRNSVSWGNGVYKSTDGGKSWKHCGLADTHHIGRVVVHPKNPDVAYVAALGHFWGPNNERGLYKTTDGGKTWRKSKTISADTGFVDLQMDPADPETLYAAAWQVRRDAFSGGSPRTQVGDDGGLFKTSDGGKTWEKMAGGLPEKVGYGRCGLSVYRKDPNVVFAIVHTSETVGQLSNTGQAATAVGKDGKVAKVGPTERGGIFRSDDKGLTWKKINDLVPRPFYYGQIRVDPSDDQNLYVLGVSFHVSRDGGVTFPAFRTTMHSDHHAMWINPKDSDNLIVGNDGGLYVSKDRGKTFEAKRGLVISQFYGVAVDSKTPYNVYGGLQDNGSWGGPVATPYPDGVTLADWKRLLGGDGFQAAVDPEEPNTVYVESQYGNLNRVDVSKFGGGGGFGRGATRSIRPGGGQKGGQKKGDQPKGEQPKGPSNRFNWNAPILLSPHDAKTLYYGGQFLYKTTDRGDKWQKISPDLTAWSKAERPTNSGHTILSTAESPVKRGVLWVGTDDGKLWVSKNDGGEWTDLTEKLSGAPTERAIPRIECSHFDAGTAYVVVDRHRNDDFKPYVFVTTDYGQTWKALANNLPPGAVVGVVRQSSRAKDLLFAGTELGLYASLDAGKTWHHLDKTGLPRGVRVDDLVIHPRERDLVVGTHGRGIWVMDVSPLEQLSSKVIAAEAHLFAVKPVTLVKQEVRPEPAAKAPAIPKGAFTAPNPPQGITVHFLTTASVASKVAVTCKDPTGKQTGIYLGKGAPGLDSVVFEVKEPGEYTIDFNAGEVTQTRKVMVKREGGAKADE
jgi:photosystem II stability/assembly factor-like uncharacterized protein